MRDKQGRVVVSNAISLAAPSTARLIITQVFTRFVAAGGSRVQHVSAECSRFVQIAPPVGAVAAVSHGVQLQGAVPGMSRVAGRHPPRRFRAIHSVAALPAVTWC